MGEGLRMMHTVISTLYIVFEQITPLGELIVI